MSLKREMILAIVLGALLGAFVALIIAQVPQKLLTQAPAEKELIISPTATPPLPPSLEILLPSDQALVNQNTITVSGTASPQATVILTTPFDEQVTTASADGTFSSEISLEEGANEIIVVSIANEDEMEKSIVVNYTKEEL